MNEDDRGSEEFVKQLHAQERPLSAKDLPRDRLNYIVDSIAEILWLDVDYIGDYWNCDKDWSPGSGTLDFIAETMRPFRPDLGDYTE